MGAALDKGDLRFLLAELSAKADAGDEDAAVRLNGLAAQCKPDVVRGAAEIEAARIVPFTFDIPALAASLGFELPPIITPAQKPTLGDILGEALASNDSIPDPWAVIFAAVELIAGHYRLLEEDVWSVIFDLEERYSQTDGADAFGDLLERPYGFALLGLRVAQTLIGDEADDLPAMHLNIH